MDVQAGNLTASEYAQPTFVGMAGIPRPEELADIRERGYRARQREHDARGGRRGLAYLFRIRRTKGVERLISRPAKRGEKAGWKSAGQGWEGVEDQLQLQGWSRARRVIVLRRQRREHPAVREESAQLELAGWALDYKGGAEYEHAVLVTSWNELEILAVAQAYRDRADTENLFDELKNQWGWTGFSTQDLKRSQLMARIVALIFNWWSLYTRLASGNKHGEAITTRPMFLQGIARQTQHAKQTIASISSLHAKARILEWVMAKISTPGLASADSWRFRFYPGCQGRSLERFAALDGLGVR